MRSASVLVLVLPLAFASSDRCQELTSEFCATQPYNRTIMPNILNHTTLDMAALEAHQFAPLVKVGCSPSLASFLCLLYFPPCTVLDVATPPCRELCQAARDGCEPLMNKFGLRWPFSCEQYPAAGGLCAGAPVNVATSPPPPPPARTTSAPPSIGTSAEPVRPTPAACATAPPLTDLAAIDRMLTQLLQYSERLQELHEQNLRLEQQKLQLEIELLQRQLRSG
ncbi:frizzled-7-B-like [Pollicipes pollicipes]|uniref:frizzled-7-B-like n=1 Tax=Pollicipes pollicipes TaxID=41117 RepID=UPI0018856087|nr:frizzled-7-B-like [Pollicipes pollicipes]